MRDPKDCASSRGAHNTLLLLLLRRRPSLYRFSSPLSHLVVVVCVPCTSFVEILLVAISSIITVLLFLFSFLSISSAPITFENPIKMLKANCLERKNVVWHDRTCETKGAWSDVCVCVQNQ